MNTKTETQFLFTIIPFRIIRDHKLLTSAERDMLIQIIAFGKNGCFYSIEHWRKITERGDHAIYRGLYKLQLLGIISIYKGNRTTSNLYRYKPNPAQWNLPAYLQQKLNNDLATMGKAPIQFNEGFKSLNHFIYSFNSLHPTYAIKKNNDLNEDLEITPSVSVETVPEEKKPTNKINILEYMKSLGISASPAEIKDNPE